MTRPKCTSPFLRWAGGKTWLTGFVLNLTENLDFNHYYEPFVGGGAIFFALHPREATISDSNEELIHTYITLREQTEDVIMTLKTFENTRDCYYKTRATIHPDDDVYMCARFIYLNRTSYNGLYRVNYAGMYNVPYGNRKIDFVKEDHIREVSKMLQDVDIRSGDFALYQNEIREGDLVFLDPPYTVSHNQNAFIKYNQTLFRIEDQRRLRELIDSIKAEGAYYILTNAAHETIQDIFDCGDRRYVLSRHSTIGGNNAQRGHVDEYVFTNIQMGE